MSVNIYARVTKLHDVAGRIDYACNPARQEHLLATTSTVVDDPTYWQDLSAEAQAAWLRKGGRRSGSRCCEAREIHGDLPNCALDLDCQELADAMARFMKDKYDVDCVVAIHLNKAENNLHYHIIFSERYRLAEPEIRRAGSRAVFLDEDGLQKRTKKEILDDAGQLRPGCRIVPKGEIISERRFGDKAEIFKSKGWLHDFKQDMSTWINETLQPDEKRVVFDPTGPFLAQIHIGKGVPDEKKVRIEEYNTLAKKFNQGVQHVLATGGSMDDVQNVKTEILLSPDRTKPLKQLLHGVDVLDGGVRTKQGKNEAQKRQLRELYRLAALERKKAREATNDIDRRLASVRAREYSAKIDALRRQLGYSTDDRWEVARRAEVYRRLQRKGFLQRWKELRRLSRREGWLQQQMKTLEEQIADAKKNYRTVEAARLKREKKELEKSLMDVWRKKDGIAHENENWDAVFNSTARSHSIEDSLKGHDERDKHR